MDSREDSFHEQNFGCSWGQNQSIPKLTKKSPITKLEYFVIQQSFDLKFSKLLPITIMNSSALLTDINKQNFEQFMKLTTLLISILVFLMSGVVCFLTSSEVFAQVPQTKRSEQDSFLKNVRAKKRNNDLQKTNRSKKYKKETSKIRIRAMFMG